MNTRDIADALKLTAQLMELHNDNPFKSKSLTNVAFKLSKTNLELGGMSLAELEKIEGVGKGIAQKILELQTTGTTKDLKDLLDKTPTGVVEMMDVKGLGPKKVGLLWNELGIESVGELMYACKENRLITLKGFGEKTQESVKKAIEFMMGNIGKFHYAAVEQFADELVEKIKKEYSVSLISLTGAIRRKCEVIEQIDILAATDTTIDTTKYTEGIAVKINVIPCTENEFYLKLFETTASSVHLEQLPSPVGEGPEVRSEEAIYHSLHLPYILPELREGLGEIELAKQNKLPKLIEFTDLKGILHNHTTYSDGMNTLEEMAIHCKELGYEYLGICDHSQTAVYAGGLKPDKIIAQQDEIDVLNKKLAPFKILKGIESDILNDGSLDYEEDVLKTFDFVVASVHSNLKMDEEKATKRLLKAIENPYTKILGHPTGRLLLSRPGYPIDYKKIIDACAANGVVIELNAHPYRLDIDWRWIPYCLEKGVKISINPDAHEKSGYQNMYYGVCAARKGMLTKEMCLNAMSLKEIEEFFRLSLSPRG